MSLQQLAVFLLWCAVLNGGLLIAWAVLFVMARHAMYSVHSRWFAISEERFAAIHYTGMMLYKIGIVLFTIIPYIVLRVFVM